MGNYPLENLGPHRFQQLCQSLLSKSFPNAQCYPISQPDGGRDAVSISEKISGKEVIFYQVKFTRNAIKERQPHKHLVDALRRELPKYNAQINKKATKYVLLTNVPGTGKEQTGSIDVVQTILEEHIQVQAQCWWRDEIERRLDDAWNIKWSFPEVLRNQDILRIIIERGLTEDAERRTSALRAFLREQYEYDTDVRFKQIDLQNKLLELFIDVPINLREFNDPIRRPGEHRTLFEISRKYANSQRHSESQLGAATFLLDPIAQEHLPRVVIEGAPGQGKSTIVQYVCQFHRERLLKKGIVDPLMANEHKNSLVRLPFKVDCRDFAVWLSGRNPFLSKNSQQQSEATIRSLETFLAAQIQFYSGGARFEVNDVQAVVKMSAVLIVFDGLDEVADIKERRNVVDEIIKGVRRIGELCISLQTIVTSRPTTFANSPGLPHSKFLYLHLSPISREAIESYAEKWVQARQLRERAARDVRETLQARLDHPHLRDLARNPMQLTILLSLIHRKGASLPDKRTALYDSYMSLFFDREAEKSEVVREHRDLLIDIHRYLAWILHSDAQTQKTAGRIDRDRLRDVVRHFLQAGKHSVELMDRLFTGVVERVVALVSRIEGTYEFEVQPMREYFAARYLYDTAPYSPAGDVRPGTLPERFEALARDSFWQNVTRFYAGCYSQGELPSLLKSLTVLAHTDEFKNSCYTQSLAVTLLSDYTFAQYPPIAIEVASFILNSTSFRLLAASEQFGRRSTSLYFPKGSGNDELIARSVKELRERPEPDYVQLLVEIIRNNSEIQVRKDIWWNALNGIKNDRDQTQWISIGLGLGVITPEHSKELDKLLNCGIAEYRKRVFNLATGGMWSYISQNGKHASTAVDMVLDRDNSFEFYPREGLIHQFALALSQHRYSVALRDRSTASLSEIWDRYHLYDSTRDEQQPSEGKFEILENCRAFVHKSRDLSGNMSTDAWSSQLKPWEDLTEYGRQIFGSRWAFCVLANLAAGIRSKQEQCVHAGNPFEEDVPIVHRARHARLRAGQWSWWRRHMAEALQPADVAFLLLLIFSWAGPTVLLRLKDEIEDRLSELEVEWWQKMFSALQNRVGLFDRLRAINLGGDELGEAVSERMVVALSQRAGERTRRILYQKYLRQYEGDDTAIMEYCQELAFDAAVGGEVDEWRKWLPGISRRSQIGIASFGLRRPWAFVDHRKPLPLSVAEEILSQSEKYPIALIARAEQVCRANVSKKVVPVGRVAEKRNWFNDNSDFSA